METVTKLLDFECQIRAFWCLRLYNVPNLTHHDDRVSSNNAALSNLRRNDILFFFFFFLEQNCCADMRSLSLTLYIDFCLLSSHIRGGLLLLDGRSRDCRSLSGSTDCQSDGRVWRQRKTNYCKCTHCMLCLIIMCNVAALTFYATIYEDICCICNKSSEKHVLGTASTAGSLCSFDTSVRTSRPGLA